MSIEKSEKWLRSRFTFAFLFKLFPTYFLFCFGYCMFAYASNVQRICFLFVSHTGRISTALTSILRRTGWEGPKMDRVR